MPEPRECDRLITSTGGLAYIGHAIFLAKHNADQVGAQCSLATIHEAIPSLSRDVWMARVNHHSEVTLCLTTPSCSQGKAIPCSAPLYFQKTMLIS